MTTIPLTEDQRDALVDAEAKRRCVVMTSMFGCHIDNAERPCKGCKDRAEATVPPVDGGALISPEELHEIANGNAPVLSLARVLCRAAETVVAWQKKATDINSAAIDTEQNLKGLLAEAQETLAKNEHRRHQLAMERNKALTDLLRERQRLTVLRHDHPRGLLIDRIFDHPALNKVVLVVRPGYITLSTDATELGKRHGYTVTAGINERGFLDLIEWLDALLEPEWSEPAPSGRQYKVRGNIVWMKGEVGSTIVEERVERIPIKDVHFVCSLRPEARNAQ